MAKVAPWVSLLLGALLFLSSVTALKGLPQRFSALEMTTVLPRFVQVVLAGGDRFLASNIDVFRALTASGNKPSRSKLHVQGQIHADASWLNPAHEDNYYVAAAMLPWNGEFELGDYVLEHATTARPYDFMPPFFRGFNHFYFRRDRLTGAGYVKLAAQRANDEQNREAFETIAARWTERGSTPDEGIRLLAGMKATTRSEQVRKFLQDSIDNLQKLIELRKAAERFQLRFGRSIHTLDELVSAGMLQGLPTNPPGRMYVLDPKGIPDLIDQRPAAKN